MYTHIRTYRIFPKLLCQLCLVNFRRNGMREKKIEQKLVTAVKKHGGICPKFVSPGFDGMPDRLLLLPHGRFAFVEVKAPNQKPRPLQLSRHRLLRRLGFRVYVLDALEDIDKIIKEVMSNEAS